MTQIIPLCAVLLLFISLFINFQLDMSSKSVLSKAPSYFVVLYHVLHWQGLVLPVTFCSLDFSDVTVIPFIFLIPNSSDAQYRQFCPPITFYASSADPFGLQLLDPGPGPCILSSRAAFLSCLCTWM